MNPPNTSSAVVLYSIGAISAVFGAFLMGELYKYGFSGEIIPGVFTAFVLNHFSKKRNYFRGTVIGLWVVCCSLMAYFHYQLKISPSHLTLKTVQYHLSTMNGLQVFLHFLGGVIAFFDAAALHWEHFVKGFHRVDPLKVSFFRIAILPYCVTIGGLFGGMWLMGWIVSRYGALAPFLPGIVAAFLLSFFPRRPHSFRGFFFFILTLVFSLSGHILYVFKVSLGVGFQYRLTQLSLVEILLHLLGAVILFSEARTGTILKQEP